MYVGAVRFTPESVVDPDVLNDWPSYSKSHSYVNASFPGSVAEPANVMVTPTLPV